MSVFKEATRFPFFKNLKCGMKCFESYRQSQTFDVKYVPLDIFFSLSIFLKGHVFH
jgi:hypothetical protein